MSNEPTLEPVPPDPLDDLVEKFVSGEALPPLGGEVHEEALRHALNAVAKWQRKRGIAWRFAERYRGLREVTCGVLENAGYSSEPTLSGRLREALSFPDPRIITSSVLALLRRKERVGAKPLEAAAACHETRNMLYDGLQSLGLEKRFPENWRTFEAFAAARMVEWLAFPTELGREPDELELGEKIWVDRRGKLAVYVWKFRNKGEPWKAGVSGPHKLVGKARPVEGWMTFSRYEQWDSATPEGHVGKCRWTVNEMAGER
jgi:hypothetical protein